MVIFFITLKILVLCPLVSINLNLLVSHIQAPQLDQSHWCVTDVVDYSLTHFFFYDLFVLISLQNYKLMY